MLGYTFLLHSLASICFHLKKISCIAIFNFKETNVEKELYIYDIYDMICLIYLTFVKKQQYILLQNMTN